MTIRLNDDQPIFQQIAELIEANIIDDSIKEGEQVPSTNEIAKHYQINPATAAKGINLLVDEGVLYKRRGIGMFVSETAKSKIIKKKKNEFYHQFIQPMILEAKRIEVTEEQITNWVKEGMKHED
ncbi:GntR family transcriptional regulator [Halalkalibacillus sediminis]|uniref:GntR family transcriptional regulator n=1 Tax=Halalkalibacillus sediminis TaxID=2018042 RepID=A0A2I0QS60_9BACI|nr:GntR family transcriptional regulator [Halalkalibacillus sediminis]PKR77171.1 GntR family transcriptional regulator [Halalkalibacillus sediminis]